MGKTIMWFRKDLRFDDNTAFLEMIKNEDTENSYICIFQLNPDQFIPNSFNHKAFFTSVDKFQQLAKKKDITIHFLYGEPEDSFKQLKMAYKDWDTIYFNEDQRGFGDNRDHEMRKFFKKNQITIYSYQDSHLHGVEEIKKPDGKQYKVFTPYFKQWQTKQKRRYQHIKKISIDFDVLDHPLFEKGKKEFNKLVNANDFPFEYDYGEEVAERYLKDFVVNDLQGYDKNRDFPALNKTSKLSRFLRTGELSIRKVWQAIQAEPESNGKQTFISELCWRDFYNMIYAEYPQQKEQANKEQYKTLKWSQNKHHFDCWKNGETGYPIVDAAMKQLNQTGWMHNRLRMIVASFLTKDLLIDWRWGERYFQKQLIDYDPASNIGGWQWAASTGTDAVPYFRLFNPTTQSERFDKNGIFIRDYLPALKKVKNEYIHAPHKMPKAEQKASKCEIGKDYPAPIIDHKKMRKQTLAFYSQS